MLYFKNRMLFLHSYGKKTSAINTTVDAVTIWMVFVKTVGVFVEERAKITSRYDVWQSLVQFKRWWRTYKWRNGSLGEEEIKTDIRVKGENRSGRPSTTNHEEYVNNLRATFERSP